MKLVPPIGFVGKAPSKVTLGKAVPVRITDMTGRDALWWDARFGPYHASIASRPDRLWSWTALLPACHLMQLAKRRYCRPLVIWARADNNQFMRVGMSIVIENYPHLDVAAPSNAHFVWFISAAEKDVLIRHFQMSNPPSLGRILLDNAMVLSLNAGLEGRIGLHAAAKGGATLMQLYVKYGLMNLQSAASLPRSIRRRNDGRFFYADDATAQKLLRIVDPSR